MDGIKQEASNERPQDVSSTLQNFRMTSLTGSGDS